MATLTYEEIEPLIASTEVQGENLHVRFRCPETEHIVDAEAPIESPDSLLPLPTEKGGFLSGARNALFGIVRRGNTPPTPAPSEEALQDAAVAAFMTVRHQFRKDTTGRWIAFADTTEELSPLRPLSADFVEQTKRGPVIEESDRGTLVRLLSEVAQSDSRLARDEQSFLEEFIGLGEEAGEQRISTIPLTQDELRRVADPVVRETMLMLAWGIALTDEELTLSEQNRLTTLAVELDIATSRATELKRYAQLFILEAALEPGEADANAAERREQALSLGIQIGMTGEETRNAVARYLQLTGTF